MKNEKPEYLAAEYNYDTIIFDNQEEAEYPQTLIDSPYYGFYLVSKKVGHIIAEDHNWSETDGNAGAIAEIDLMKAFHIEALSSSDGQTESKRIPYTLRLLFQLEEFVILREADQFSEQEEEMIERINQTVRDIESGRLPTDPFRKLDVQLARKWCRVFRLYAFLQMRSERVRSKESLSKDLRICRRRGLSSGYLNRIEYRARFYRLMDQKLTGKIILLAEEWENRCISGEIAANPFIYEMIALSFFDTEEDYKTGYEWLMLLIGRHPNNTDFMKWKARYLRRAGNLRGAHEICDQLLQDNPTDFETHCFQSNLFYMEEKYKEAQKSALIATSCDETSPLGHIALAFSYLNDQQYEEAILSFNRAIESDPQSVDAMRGKSKALVMIGEAYDAMNCLVQAVRISPVDADLFRELADVYFMTGYVNECRKYCRKCLSLDPYSASAFVLLGMLEIRENHVIDAVKWLKRSLAIEPDNPIALNELAYVEHMNGNDDECLRLLEQALNIAPDFADVVCSMGVVYYFKGDYETSNALLDRALELDPLHVGAMVTKGNSLLSQSLPEDALAWYERALEIEDDFPDAIRGKVDALRALGLEDEAAEWTKKEGELFDDNDR